MKKIFWIAVVVLFFCVNASAEIIQLTTGESVDCRITKRDLNFIRVSCKEGLPVREYLLNRVATITKNGQVEYINPLEERVKAKKVISKNIAEAEKETIQGSRNHSLSAAEVSESIKSALPEDKVSYQGDVITVIGTETKTGEARTRYFHFISSCQKKFDVMEGRIASILQKNNVDVSLARPVLIGFFAFAALVTCVLLVWPFLLMGKRKDQTVAPKSQGNSPAPKGQDSAKEKKPKNKNEEQNSSAEQLRRQILGDKYTKGSTEKF